MTATPPSLAAGGLTVRKATPDDVAALMPLIRGAYRGESSRRGWTSEADLIAGERIDSAGLLLKINEPSGAVLIAFPSAADSSSSSSSASSTPAPEAATAVSTSAPVACCEVVKGHGAHGGEEGSGGDGGDDDTKAYFGLFAVDPERQGGGLGKAVLGAAEAYARDELGASHMEMTVIWTRGELIDWYLRRGYARTGEKRPFPYGVMENGVPLRDDLYFDVLLKQL